jgi:preprotein translocase subunit SecF
MSRLGHLGGRLYRGDISIDFVGRAKKWYMISGLILVVSIVSLLTLGLNLSIEFKGGTVFQFNATSTSTTANVTSTIKSTGVVKEDPIVQKTGSGWRVETEALDTTQVTKVQTTIAQQYDLKNKAGAISPDAVSPETVGASWGQDISQKALKGMIIFIAAIIVYLSIAFEWRMAAAAIVALAHDILITVGVYSLVQFEVSPATVVGLLTILGYSLYDTVVVFDKVRENTRSLLTTGGNKTYSDAANLAVNQTLVRSINTSVIALLPVAGLLFIGAGLLGAGTLKDLALVLFVGMIAGTYSSIFIATPITANLKERQPEYRELAKRLAAKSASAKRRSRQEAKVSAKPGDVQDVQDVTVDDQDVEPDEDSETSGVGATNVRVVQQGPRQQPRRGGSKGRPSGKRKR